MHGDPEPMIWIGSILLIAWLFVTVFGYSTGLGASDAIVGFFSQPRPLIVYGILLLAPAFFVKYLPGSIITFIASVILFLSLRAGVS
ncbi:MAG: hypothetical protein AABX01_00355 [Candidatus Micrarchaeota archaeon]